MAPSEDEGDSQPRASRASWMRVVMNRIAGVIFPPNISLAAFLPLVLLLITEGVTGSSVNSYAGYLIVDVGAASSTNEVGVWAGVLSSSFFACQFVSSIVLGFLSDKVGRKPLLLVGTGGVLATQLAFGFSRNIWMAIVFRSLNGLLNGNVATVKACIGEMTDATNRASAFAWVGLSFGIGNILGAFLGGVLARPAVTYPGKFSPDGFFGRFPYALPNIVVSAFVLLAFLSNVFFVKETNGVSGKSAPKRYKAIGDDEEEGEAREKSRTAADVELDVAANAGEATEEGEEERGEIGDGDESEVPEAPKKESCVESIGRMKTTANAILQYTLICGVQIIAQQMISVWTVATVDAGGLGFSVADVGILNSIGAVSMIATLMFVAGPVVKRLKILWTIRIAAILLIPVVCSMPVSSVIARRGAPKWAVWAVIGSLVFGWQLFAQIMMNNAIVAISNSVPPHKMGRANGIGQSFGSLARAISPVTVGPLLVWCLMPGRKFPLDSFLPFFIMGGLSFLYMVCSFFLPQSINYPFNQQSPAAASHGHARVSPAVPSVASPEEDGNVVSKT